MGIFNWLLWFAICLVFVFTLPTFAFAQDTSTPVRVADVTYEKVNPDGGFTYLYKRLGEKMKLLALSFSPKSKESYYQELAQRRLAELRYVIDKPDMSNFEKATIRYSTTIGEWTEFMLEKKLDDRRAPTVAVLEKHLPVVEQLMNKYDGTTAEWRFVKQDADYIRIYISKLQS